MALPTPLQTGDIFGFHFPTSPAPHPHPGIVLKALDHGPERTQFLTRKKLTDIPGTQLCMLLMVSHAAPQKGEYGELIPVDHRKGTHLDMKRDIYACYRHFDVAFVPGQEREIASVNGPYLGRLDAAVLTYYRSQFLSVQAYLKGQSFRPPQGVFVA